jgi:hypothetical protein
MSDSTGDMAARIVASAARDSGGDDFEAAQERHARRMRAMRALGDIEQHERRLHLFSLGAVVLVVLIIFIGVMAL